MDTDADSGPATGSPRPRRPSTAQPVITPPPAQARDRLGFEHCPTGLVQIVCASLARNRTCSSLSVNSLLHNLLRTFSHDSERRMPPPQDSRKKSTIVNPWLSRGRLLVLTQTTPLPTVTARSPCCSQKAHRLQHDKLQVRRMADLTEAFSTGRINHQSSRPTATNLHSGRRAPLQPWPPPCVTANIRDGDCTGPPRISLAPHKTKLSTPFLGGIIFRIPSNVRARPGPLWPTRSTVFLDHTWIKGATSPTMAYRPHALG